MKTNPELKLYPVNKDDPKELQEVISIVEKFHSHTAYPFTLDKAISPGLFLFKAYRGEDLIGVSGIDSKTPTLAETVKTIVLEPFRGQKLGALLSQAIEEECRSRGIKKVITTIYADNHAMIAIKLKQGYTIEGYHPDHEAPGFHEYSLGKVLK